MLLTSKDPDEIIFYDFDWGTKRLAAGESILDFGFEVDGGSVAIAASPPPELNGSIARVWLEGGEIGDVCYLTSWVETNLNPRRDFTGKIKVKTKTR